MKDATAAGPQIPMHADTVSGVVPPVMSQGEFARHRGVSEPMVSRWKAKGYLVMTPEAKVDVAATQELLARVLDPARGGKRGATPAGAGAALQPAPAPAPARAGRAAAAASGESDADKANYNLQAARERRAKAQLAELELAREAGALVDAEEVRSQIAGRVGDARNALMQIGRRVSAQLALLDNARDIEAVLDEECRRVCDVLAGARAHDEAQAA